MLRHYVGYFPGTNTDPYRKLAPASIFSLVGILFLRDLRAGILRSYLISVHLVNSFQLCSSMQSQL